LKKGFKPLETTFVHIRRGKRGAGEGRALETRPLLIKVGRARSPEDGFHLPSGDGPGLSKFLDFAFPLGI